MRYDAAHKAQSRAKILEAARARFRRHGFAGASIDQVMSDAGLTRGAFYAHFASKDALIAEVLAIEAGLVRNLQDAAASENPQEAVLAALAHYLDPAEREDVAFGCPLVAHPTDVTRGKEAHREAYGARIEGLLRALEPVMSAPAATEAMLLAVGAALISAAIHDPAEADRIEGVALARLKELLSAELKSG